MLYLHKLLPLLLMPMMLCSLLLAYAWLARKRWPIVLALVLLLVSSNQWVANQLMRNVEQQLVRLPANQSSVGQADAVVVLSGMLRDVKGPNNTTLSEWGDAADRFEGGVALWQAGVAPKLLLTGGRLPWSANAQTEGQVLRDWAIARGIPASAIEVTTDVQNTAQEASAIGLLLGLQPHSTKTAGATAHISPPRIVLVTSAFHMPRAKALFEQAGMQVTPYAVDFRVEARATNPYDWLPSARAAKDFELAYRELLARGFYWLLKMVS